MTITLALSRIIDVPIVRMGFNVDKEFILAEIRRTALHNGGKALGAKQFTNETGIREYDWRGRYWARWGDALREAELTPNEFGQKYDTIVLCEAYARFAIELGHLPVPAEVNMRKKSDQTFPGWDSFSRRGSKKAFIGNLLEFCTDRPEFLSVRQWCVEYLETKKSPNQQLSETVDKKIDGFVYLAKTRRGYKIGRTDDWEQRLRQIQLHNADDVELVHLIKTDDPSGVEAYWHRRFKTRRVVAKSKTGKRRNWYNLTADDVRAFNRWKQI